MCSFVIGVWAVASLVLWNIPFISEIVGLPRILPGGNLTFFLIGLICGIIGLVRKEPNKKFAIMGIIICLPFSIWGITALSNVSVQEPIY